MGYELESGLRRIAAFTPQEEADNNAYETSPAVRDELTRAIRNERNPSKRNVLEQSYQSDFGQPSGVPGASIMAQDDMQSTMDSAFAAMDAIPGRNQKQSSATPASRIQSPEIGDDDLSAAFAAMDKVGKPKKKTSVLGDSGRLLKVGANTAAQDVRELVGKIPVIGQPIQSGMDWIDEKTHGGVSSDALLKSDNASMQTGMSSAMQDAQQKKWWDQDKGSLGDAWLDPRAYQAGILQSLPEQALMMFPVMRLAKGAYAARVIGGATQEVASLAAARTAQVAGSVIEGALGGAQSSREVRDEILDKTKVTDEMLGQSDAYQSLLSQGMDPKQARASLADDRASHAFLTAGVATGLFGGMGDRFLAKIITGTGHGVAKRFLMGAASEGLAEEFPQSYLQQVAQNEAVRGANPEKSLTDDALNQAMQGAATGGIQGGGMSAAFGHNSKAPETNIPTEDKVDPSLDSGTVNQDYKKADQPFNANQSPLRSSDVVQNPALNPLDAVSYQPQPRALLPEPSPLEGDVLSPEYLPTGQRALPHPAIDGEFSTQQDLPRLALPAPEPQPSVRQLATARALLNHNPTASMDTLARLMRVDDGMAQSLYNHWQKTQELANGKEPTGSTNVDMVAQGNTRQGGDVQGSGSILAPASDGVGNGSIGGSGVAVSSMRPFGPAVDGGVGSVAQVTPLDAVAHNSATSILNVTPQLTDAQNPAAHADTTPNYRQMDPVSARRTADNLTRNGYPTKAVPHPTVAGMMTTIPADETAPAVSYGPAAEPVRNSEVQTVAPVQNASVAAQTRPRQSRITPMQDERLTDVFAGYQHRLETLMDEFGLAETGGSLLRDTDGNVNDRTPWVPHSEFWPGRPGNVSERDARKYVRDALEGKPLPAAGKRFITYMLDYQDAERKQQREVSNLEEEERDSFLSKLAEAREIADNDDIEAVLERLATKHGDDADGFNIDATTYLKGLIDEVQQRNASEDGQANSAATGEGEYPSGEATPARLPEEANRPSFELQPHTREEVANKDARAADESVAAREQADQSRESFTLTPQAVEHSAASTDQGGLFTPDGRATKAARQDSVHGKSRQTSWVLRNKATKEVVMETSDRAKVDALNTEKYEAVQVGDHLAEISRREKLGRMSSEALKAVYDRLNLAGSKMTDSERVNVLMSEDGKDVDAAIYALQVMDGSSISIAGKPVSEISYDHLQNIARGLNPSYGEPAVDKAKTELRRRDEEAKANLSKQNNTTSAEPTVTTEPGRETAGNPVSETPDAESSEHKQGKFSSNGDGINDAIRELRAAAHDEDNPGDVALGNRKFASFDDVVRLAKEGISSGEIKPVPFQIVNRLDLSFRDVDRVLKAATSGQDTVAGKPVSEISDSQLNQLANSSAGTVSQDAQNSAKTEIDRRATKQEATGTADEIAGVIDRARNGDISATEFKAAFESLIAGKERIISELSKLTKDVLFKQFPGVGYRYKNGKKADIVSAAYRSMLDDFVLGDSISWSMGDKYEDVIRGYVEKTTDASLREFADKVKASSEERNKRNADAAAGMDNPQTLQDYKNILSAKAKEIGEGATFAQARMAMTPEQRARFDELTAEDSRDGRKARADQQKTDVRVSAVSAEGQIVETKHTKTGEPLFVVKAADRVERDVYTQWNATAKRLNGWYSSFRGNGAVPGFQFKTRENADAFLAYIGGNADQAKEAVKTKRDSFADDRSQSAVVRLNEMADALDERADERLGQERKVNTSRRASMAVSAEASANSDKAMAQTMRNIAKAIQDGTAKFLDRVRQKTQIEMLTGFVRSAKSSELREKYPAYADQEKKKGEPATAETADYATFPNFTAYRSDLAKFGRQLLEHDGSKKLGARIIKVADDVTDAYLKFAKENLHKVSKFSKSNGDAASFSTKDAADEAINRSGYRGKAIVLQFKRGQNIIIMSPTEAKEQGIWQGDDDKRITLSNEMGAEIVAKNKELARYRLNMPYTFDGVAADKARLSAMGIETPAEFRAALREFIAMRETPKALDRVKELERSMVGRRNDGLDFFPTPVAVAQQMIDAADIKDGMTVLEPSAGMGHIAEQIREAGVEPDVVELSGDRRELLGAKGFNLVGHDFMDVTGEYDRIVMNPPFGDRRDAAHVQHAYELLKPGGRVVAIMGEGVFFGQDKKAQEFRDWLESVGGTSEKLDEGTFLDPSLPVNTGVNARMVVIDKPKSSGVESRAANSDIQFASNVIAELTDHDELFRYPVSKSSNLKTVFAEVYPGAKYFGEHTREDERDETSADHRFVFENHLGKRFYVYTTDAGKVWIDVSRLATFDGGNAIYAAVSNWAYNTRKKFQGDPAGVSPDATIRRTTNMLSSALRFGTTQHLEASPEQIKGDPEAGVEPLDWGANDIENIRQLIHTFTTTLYNKHPKLNDYHYDFEKQGFFDKRGTHVTQDRFDSGAEKPDAGRARAGEASLRRGVFLKSLISSESGERPGILEQVLNRSRSIVDGGLKGIPSKKTPANAGVSASGDSIQMIQSVADRFKAKFKGAAALDIRVVQSVKDIPERYRPSKYAEGVYHSDAGLVYLVADNITDGSGKIDTSRAFQILMHEAVGHYGLAKMLGSRFNGILSKVKAATGTNGRINSKTPDTFAPGHADYASWDAVKLRYPESTEEEIAQEVLARMAETDPGRTLFGYVRAVVRQWLRDTARSMGFSVETSTAELNDLVAKASGYMRAGRNLDQVALDSGSANSNTTESGLESRVHVAGDSGRQYSAEQQQTFRNIGREVETLTVKERVAGYWKDIGKRLTQGIADQFAPLKDLDQKAYMLARMSKGADGALEAMMMHGRVFIRDGGIYDVDAKDGGVIDKLLRPLGNEIDDFMWWVAGNRADTLAGLGKENLMTPDDIRSLKALADGKLGFDYTLRDGKKTRNRAEAYAEANAILQDFNKSVMDIAEESGLIDGEARAIWERDFYVPFYRDMEGDKPNFPSVKSGLVRQKAFERLKGGTGKLNHDLLANTLLNWSHLLGAAAKNRAAKASLDAAVKVGAAVKLASSENSSVSYRENGNEVHFEVIDPFVLNAVTALEFSGSSNPAIQAMGAFKRWLTIGVTANPAFKIRNLIRDSISAIGQGDLSYNIAKNLKEGYKGTNKESQTYASMLAGGGIIRFGTMIEGNRADHVRRLTEKGIDPNTIIDDESKLKMVWNRYLSPLLDAYNELGDRSENINRAALYEQLIAKGMGHAEASLAARDLMDFSMGGTFTLVRFLTQTVPFANARLQGLYKLGRAAKEDPRRMGYVVGAVALASLALLAAYGDDDDWKKREDWDRDNYWWFKIGDTAFRIPKPFEIGAIGTLAERSAELLFDEEMDGHRFGTRLLKMAGDTFKLNPVPQMFKPALDLYSNTDSFTGRPIESMGMERLRTEDRFTGRTSEVAKLLGSAGVLSPVQIDHVIRGYFGWLGTAAVTTVDQISHLSDDTERPSMKLRDTFLAGNFVETLPSNSSRYVSQMYSQSKEIEEAYNSWRNYIKTGDTEAAKEVYESEKDKIAKYKIVANIKQAEARLTAQARLIESNRTMSGEAKRDALDKIAKQKDKLARSIVRSAGFK